MSKSKVEWFPRKRNKHRTAGPTTRLCGVTQSSAQDGALIPHVWHTTPTRHREHGVRRAPSVSSGVWSNMSRTATPLCMSRTPQTIPRSAEIEDVKETVEREKLDVLFTAALWTPEQVSAASGTVVEFTALAILLSEMQDPGFLLGLWPLLLQDLPRAFPFHSVLVQLERALQDAKQLALAVSSNTNIEGLHPTLYICPNEEYYPEEFYEAVFVRVQEERDKYLPRPYQVDAPVPQRFHIPPDRLSRRANLHEFGADLISVESPRSKFLYQLARAAKSLDFVLLAVILVAQIIVATPRIITIRFRTSTVYDTLQLMAEEMPDGAKLTQGRSLLFGLRDEPVSVSSFSSA
ncbi:hypothetical protein B0H14DRAFT_2615972 [Mycena olivaceomarginata]|nr:hypothetical protein B0H14DRAFT_2615972 [Mycena olivaceomarginata]